MVNKPRALVTGAAGVIGRQLTKRLLNDGHEVMAIDRKVMPDLDWGKLEFIQGDLSEMDLSEAEKFQPEAVFHLAASFERSEESAEYWDIGWRDDVVSSHRVIDSLARSAHTRTFVFASSYLTYEPSLYLFDAPNDSPASLNEIDRVSPRNLCGAGKYYTEQELAYVTNTTRPDLRVVNARIYRVYGKGSRDVISRWIEAGLAGETIEVYNKSNRFDYVFADDVAESLHRLQQQSEASGVYNIGTGSTSSISEVVEALKQAEVLSPSQIVEQGESAPFEASKADVRRLREDIGWTPPTTPLEGIRQISAALQGADLV